MEVTPGTDLTGPVQGIASSSGSHSAGVYLQRISYTLAVRAGALGASCSGRLVCTISGGAAGLARPGRRYRRRALRRPSSLAEVVATLAALRSAALSAVLLAAALALGAAPPAGAAPAASWALSPVGQLRYTLAAGATASGAIVVVNDQAQAQALDLYAADMLAIAGGGFAPAPSGAAMTGVGAWLHLAQDSVSVPAGATVRVAFTLQVPAGAGPGDYDGAIVAGAPAAAGAGLGVLTRTALTVQVSLAAAAGEILAGQATTVAAPGGATVTVPAGALPPGSTLTLAPGGGGAVPEFPAFPAGATAVVSALALGATDPSANPLTVPAQPVLVRLPLPAGALPAGLLVFEFDPVLHAWLPLPTTVGGGTALAAADRLSAVAVLADPGLPVYPDVAGSWEEGPVLALAALGAVGGYPDGTFRPAQAVSRAEFAALLQRGLHLAPGSAAALSGFPDAAAVPSWAAPALAAAAGAGLLQGGAGGALDPGGDLSRAEAAVIAARALGLGAGKAPAFQDAAAIPSWAAGAVAAAVQDGLLQGYPDGTFRPLQPVTRAEAAALLLRLLRAHGA